MTTLSPGDEVTYGTQDGMVSKVIAIDGDDAWCISLRTGERFTVKVAALKRNETEGS